MSDNTPQTISNDRKMNQRWLDTFTHDKNNILDSAINRLIEDLKEQIGDARSENAKWSDVELNDPEKFEELEKKGILAGRSLRAQIYDNLRDVIYLQDELFALFEMKIIYAFKHLEITIKQLLSLAYQDEYINRQFKWDTIVEFLSSKSIDVKKLNAYEAVNQLRNLNNALKHSNKVIDQSLQNIPEFKDKETFSNIELDSFYNRIKNAPGIFLISLVSAVFKDLYSFDFNRLHEMAKSLALRMEKTDALLFSDELTKLY